MRNILLSVFLLSSFALLGQKDQIRFQEYGVKEGLPEEVAITIYEDNQGYIWIATQNGLVKYDGYSMQTFGPNQGKQGEALQIRSLTGGIFQGKDDRIWIAGSSSDKSGLAIYDPKDQSFENILYHPDSSTLLFNGVLPIHEDLNNNVWFKNYSSELDSSILVKYNPESRETTNYSEDADLRWSQYLENVSFSENKKDSSIWIFDHYSFRIKRYDEGSDNFRTVFEPGKTYEGYTLPDSLYGVFSKDSDFVLFGYYGEVFVADQRTERIIKAYKFDFERRKQSGSNRNVNFQFWLDSKNLLWISSGNYLTVYNITDDQKQTFEFGKMPLEDAPSIINRVIPTFEDQENLYFLITKPERNAYLRYHYSDSQFYYYDEYFNHDDNSLVLKNGPAIFHKDFSGTSWIGTRPNLYREQKSPIQSYSKFGLQQKKIDSLTFPFEDSKGRVWLSYVGGMMLKEPNQEEFKIFDADEGNFPFRGVSKSVEDDEGTIWVKSFGNSGGGLARYNEQTASFDHIMAGTNTNSFYFDDKRKQLWFSNEDGIFALSKKGEVLYQLDAELTKGFTASGYFQDSQGNTWISDVGDNEHAILLLDTNDNLSVIKQIRGDSSTLSSNEIRFITEDKFKNIWIGTDGGLNKYSNGAFERVKSGSTGGHSIDKNNVMWFTTYAGEGLVSVSPESGRTVGFGLDEGMLHTDDIAYNYHNNEKIATDLNGRMYILNKRGLSIFDPSTKEFTNLETSDALTEGLYNTASISLSNGEIWFTHRQGLEIIDPKKLFEDKNRIPPKVWITSMTIMDSAYSSPDGDIFAASVDFTDNINLEYWQKNLGFEFVALHYLNPEKNQYSWKLEGYDRDWSKPSLTRSVSYTNLSPGTYTFRVRGANADGIWNEEGDFITVNIAPPIWQSNVAYLFYFLLFCSAVLIVHRIQRERTIRKERERTKDRELTQAKEIEKAYTQLKATQSQLLHSEKMASLGELTAGIAHEIQNPLNFVNNFSDLNRELIDEQLVELDKGDIEEAMVIAKDIKANEEKVTHHGRRAEEIVKSMLQHSRSGNGEKEPTDINALADEYLRLAYHGLRAKDQSFNADFKTELDPALPKVNVVPQDIGRVLLNLINNAFQAIADIDQPEVVIKTEHLFPSSGGDQGEVQITVSDNGPGIPDDIKDKIFQPFFTTKPTGEGTGLGLSMSYDIVTKGHGGQLSMKSEEGKGTKFIVELPL